VNGYINNDERILNYVSEVKKKKSNEKAKKSKKLRSIGKKIMKDLALDDGEIENIFDLLAKEHPDL
jgi:hypothetical protein